MLGSDAEIMSWAGGEGDVRVAGEIWKAVSAGGFIIQKGDIVKVTEINGLILTVTTKK